MTEAIFLQTYKNKVLFIIRLTDQYYFTVSSTRLHVWIFKYDYSPSLNPNPHSHPQVKIEPFSYGKNEDLI